MPVHEPKPQPPGAYDTRREIASRQTRRRRLPVGTGFLRLAGALLWLTLAMSSHASAQEGSPSVGPNPDTEDECLSVSPTDQVLVETFTGRTIRGTLLCLSTDGARLMRAGSLESVPLGAIERIRTTADPAWDGALKGAVIPLIFWAVLCHECPAEPMLKMSLTYGLIGLVSDAIDTNRKTLYEGRGRSFSLNWGFRF